ncbi:MAG: hypothetical protein BAA01_09425 [Bacillus thermozeamaize]|uniref:Uncharacterized protein n=1 Tax=Bacillus thermozeamaize TaxID=230954 RepID=A0A1Y3PKQ7_9BACI|nr:MAG: hypothetical protein BAA01_09425 [Bacillus thermozeamaize]
MDTGQLFTWEALATMGGASLLTYFVVQYTKSLIDRFAAGWLPTDLYAVIVASIILVTAQLALGANPADWRVYVLAGANGFLVAAAAGQMQRKAIEPPGNGKREDDANA